MAMKSEPVNLESEHPSVEMSESNDMVLNLITRSSTSSQRECQQEEVTSADHRSFLSPLVRSGCSFMSSSSDLPEVTGSPRESTTSPRGPIQQGGLSVEHYLFSPPPAGGHAHGQVPAPPTRFGSEEEGGDVFFLPSQNALPTDKRDIEFETYIIARDEEEVNSKCLPKKYKCRFCVYKTSYKSDLNRHLRKHGSSVYHCSLCKMPFRTVGNLENHRRLAHAGVGSAFYDVGAGPIEPPPPPLGNHYDKDGEVIGSARRRSHGSNLTHASPQHLLYSLAGTPSSLFPSQLRRPHPSSASSLLLPHSPGLLSATSQPPNNPPHSSSSTLEFTPLLSCRLCGFRCTDSTVYGQHQRSHQQSLVSSNSEGSRIREQQKLRENALRTKTTKPPFFRHRQTGQDHSFTNRSDKDVEGSSLGSAEVKRRRRETPFSTSSSDLVSDVQTQGVHYSTIAILPHAPVEDKQTGGKAIRDKGIAATTGEVAQMFVVSPIVSASVFLDDELSVAETCSVREFKQNSIKKSLRSLKVTHGGKIASNPTRLDSSPRKEAIPRSSNNQPTTFIGSSLGRADPAQSAVRERRPLAPSPDSDRIISFVRLSPHPQTSPSEHATDLTVTKSVSSAAKCALKRAAAVASPKVIVEKWLGHEAKGKMLTDEREESHNYDTIGENLEDNTKGGQEEEHYENNRISLIDSLHLRAHAVDDEERGPERVSVKEEPESPIRSADMDADTVGGANVEVSVETDAADASKLSLKSCASVVGREDRHMYRIECVTSRSQYEQNSESLAERQDEPLSLYDSSSLTCSRSEDESKRVDCRYCGNLVALSDVVDYSRECQWDHKEEPTAYRVCGQGFASTTTLPQRNPSLSSSFADTCVHCAHQLVGKNILAKHMQKRHLLTSSLAARDGQVERIATSPNRHMTGSDVSGPRKGVATPRPTLERKALSHAAGNSDGRWTGSSNVWSYRDVLPGNNQSLSRSTICLPGACAVKPLFRRDKALASPTRFVPTARADRGQGEAVYHPPLTTTTTTVGRFARLESDFDDFAARPYACALCFFRTNQLWELQAHAQNHLTGCNATPSEETPGFQASPAFRQDRATSPFRSCITRDAGAEDNVCARGTFKGRQTCADSASGSSLRTISSGGFYNSAVVENVNKTWRKCTPTFQPRSKSQASNKPLSDGNPDHLDDQQMPEHLLSIPVVSDEKKPCIFHTSNRQHPLCTKVRKINTNDLQARYRRMRVDSKTAGQRFDKRFNKIADPASSGYRNKSRLLRTLKAVAFKKNMYYSGDVARWEGHNNWHCLSSSDHPVREDSPGDGTHDSHLQRSCQQNMSLGNNGEASAAHPSSSHESSLSGAAAAKGWTASQTSEVGSQSRKQTLKPKVSRAMRTKRIAGSVLGRLKVHACKLCSKAFTLKQLLKRHHRTFHRDCPVTDSSESADNIRRV